MNAASFFEKRSKPFWVIVGVVLVIILGIIDYLSGYEVSISLFYLFPILLVVWYTDGQMGLVLSFASTVVGFIANYSAGQSYSHPLIYFWNVILRLGFYCVVTWLSWMLKRTNKINQELARTDYVTGAISIRYFYELAQIEISRFQRYRRPFTLVYIDLDNFKAINDRLGHSTGDRVLRAVTDSVRRQVRPGDTLARLGGDEFALLMPETDGNAARTVINRIHSSLVDEMVRNGWIVTFSLGVVTYTEVPKTVDEMVKIADNAMYSVKAASKNGVNYIIYAG
jgi:diguanylate cyclase (GGDEF)-like protein